MHEYSGIVVCVGIIIRNIIYNIPDWPEHDVHPANENDPSCVPLLDDVIGLSSCGIRRSVGRSDDYIGLNLISPEFSQTVVLDSLILTEIVSFRFLFLHYTHIVISYYNNICNQHFEKLYTSISSLCCARVSAEIIILTRISLKLIKIHWMKTSFLLAKIFCSTSVRINTTNKFSQF